MNRLLCLAASVVLAAAAVPALAAPPAQAQREIDRLITALGQSGCQFQRNGSWYDASAAQAHLRKKYDWLVKRDMVASAEQFIERAGSQSSISGKPYQVRCAGRPAVTSASWLNARLAEIRRAPAP
jgi:hypothetical protein